MTLVIQQEPVSDDEIMAATFQAIRARELKTVAQVKAVMLERFPDVDEERRQACLIKLATKMCEVHSDLFPAEKINSTRGSGPGRR